MLGDQMAAWLGRAGPFGTVAEPESTRAQAEHKALANLCRMLFNTNEFVLVD